MVKKDWVPEYACEKCCKTSSEKLIPVDFEDFALYRGSFNLDRMVTSGERIKRQVCKECCRGAKDIWKEYPRRNLVVCPICGKETHENDMVEGERVGCIWCRDGIERED